MKRQWLIGTLLGVVVNAGQAAPFLVCDPYPPDKAQPDTLFSRRRHRRTGGQPGG